MILFNISFSFAKVFFQGDNFQFVILTHNISILLVFLFISVFCSFNSIQYSKESLLISSINKLIFISPILLNDIVISSTNTVIFGLKSFKYFNVK